MSRLFLAAAVFLMLLLGAFSCGIINQANEMGRVKNCEFSFAAIEQVRLAGIDLGHLQNFDDMGWADQLKLSSSLLSGNLPLDMTLTLDVFNPNDKTAAISKMDWILELEGTEVLSGYSDAQLRILPGDHEILAIPVAMNLLEVLQGEQSQNLVSLAMRLSGDNSQQPVDLVLKFRPYLVIGDQLMKYPSYFKIKHQI